MRAGTYPNTYRTIRTFHAIIVKEAYKGDPRILQTDRMIELSKSGFEGVARECEKALSRVPCFLLRKDGLHHRRTVSSNSPRRSGIVSLHGRRKIVRRASSVPDRIHSGTSKENACSGSILCSCAGDGRQRPLLRHDHRPFEEVLKPDDRRPFCELLPEHDNGLPIQYMKKKRSLQRSSRSLLAAGTGMFWPRPTSQPASSNPCRRNLS